MNQNLRCISLSAALLIVFFYSCHEVEKSKESAGVKSIETIIVPDTARIPKDKFGEAVRYGRELMLNTAYYIGPEGKNGQYLGGKMNCTNCHQDAGTKPYSFSLLMSHENYPQYRAREGKVLSLAERVNNCVMRPLNGKPLPLESKEMIALLAYYKWINSFMPKGETANGVKNLSVNFPGEAASPERGQQLFKEHCERCHGADGSGLMLADNSTYKYPPLWGANGYQPGSSMHRVIKQAQWLKANMPQDKATWQTPFLTDEQALDIAAFVNDDRIHPRPNPKTLDYPYASEKAIDYGHAPFADSFPESQHKFGPYKPIIDYWKSKGWTPVY